MNSWQSSGRQRHGGRKDSANESPVSLACLRVVDAGFVAILFVAPFFFGGRSALGRLVFVGLTCVTGAAWCLRQILCSQRLWARSWANALGLAALLLVAFQLIPLSQDWILKLAPRTADLLPLWTTQATPGARLGIWKQLSLNPSATKLALSTLVAYVVLFITATQRLRRIGDVERLIKGIALATVLMSGFGLLQFMTSNGLFFWFYEHPFATTEDAARGSFTCRNHFAHFLSLGIAPLFAWILLRRDQALESSSRRRSPAARSLPDVTSVALCMGLVLLALGALLTLSRGGALAIGIASVVVIAIYCRRGLLTGSSVYGLALVALMVVGVLSMSKYEQVARRLDDFTTGSVEQLDRNQGRRKIWNANLAAIQHGSFFGAGAGSHLEIHHAYLPESLEVEYTHAESSYLQIATENGWLGVGLLAWGVLLVCGWCWQGLRAAQSRREVLLAGALTASLTASLSHALVDFVWFIPACMSMAILLAACALRLAQLTRTNTSGRESCVSWSRLRWAGMTAVIVLTAFWAVGVAWGPGLAATSWDRYQLVATPGNREATPPQPTDLTSQDERQIDRHTRLNAMIYHLRQILSLHPQSPRGHLRLAGKYLHQFNLRQQQSENAMSVDQIRDAAIASRFSSSQELRQWMERAIGEDIQLLYQAYYHTRQAIELCPLQGQGYIFMAQLCFLAGQDSNDIESYLTQSVLVRPHDGDVLFEVGRQRLLLGHVAEALEYWQSIFPDPGSHQVNIVQLLVADLPAAAFIQLFHPNWQTLPVVWDKYYLTYRPDDRHVLLEYAVLEAERECPHASPAAAANIWYTLAKMQADSNQLDAAIVSLNRAYQVAPNEYRVRRHLGQKLLLAEQFELAIPHLRWCLMRLPDNAALKAELFQATKARLGTAQQMAPTHF